MREMISGFVDESIDELDVPRDIKKMLKRNERKSVLIDRLTHQMKIAEKETYAINLDREKIKSVVKDFVNFFFSLAKTEADESLKSYNQNLAKRFNKQMDKAPGEIVTRVETL